MGRVHRDYMREFKKPVYKVGEIAEKTVGIKQPPVEYDLGEPSRPINQVGKTPPRPGRGKRPKPFPIPPESEITSPVEKPEQDMDKEKPTAPEEMITDVDATTTSQTTVVTPTRRRRTLPINKTQLGMTNLLGTGGRL